MIFHRHSNTCEKLNRRGECPKFNKPLCLQVSQPMETSLRTCSSPPPLLSQQNAADKYPGGRYITNFGEFTKLCSNPNAQFVFNRIVPDNESGMPFPERQSRGYDGPLTTVPFGKLVVQVAAPLSDCPEKRFFMNSVDDAGGGSVRERIIQQIAALECMEDLEFAQHTFNCLRWHVDSRDESLNWTVTHIYSPEKHKLFFNNPEHGFRIYVLE